MTSNSLLPLLRAAQADDETGLFAFYERLLRLRESHKPTIVPAMPREMAPSLTEPLLQWEDLGVTQPPFFGWLTQVAELWEQQDPGAIDELEALSPTDILNVATTWYRTGSSELGSVLDALLSNAIAPYLEEAAETVREDVHPQWRQPYCPVCGGWADMARYDEKKHRYRCICERCSSEWTVVWDGCLYCGERDEERRGFYSSEDDLHRVIICDNCGFYIKVVNEIVARRMGYNFLLAAERLLTPGLDLTAAQEGYTRPIHLPLSDKDS